MVFVWPDALKSIPASLWLGLTWVKESWIGHLDPFYQGIFHAFAIVNRLYVDKFPNPLPQQNLWACMLNKRINKPLVKAGIVEVGDLPLINGTIDWCKLQSQLQLNGYNYSVFLTASLLQEQFHFKLGWPVSQKLFPVLIGK